MKHVSLLTISLDYEQDVVAIRQRARQIAQEIGFDNQEQIRIATAVSEIARNAFQYVGKGKAEFSVRLDSPQALRIVISDEGPGISNLEEILSGNYRSKTGMGLGITGAKRLVDTLEVETSARGTTVTLKKLIPGDVARITPEKVASIANQLARTSPATPLEQVQTQNRELLIALQELQDKRGELEQINLELKDTNRGVLALYTELDEKAAALDRANTAKTAFLADMTHEFRSPLNSILNITSILTDDREAPLTAEQAKQVNFIRKSAEALSSLVNDLLDIARVEAGKMPVRITTFSAQEFVGALRGLMRPLMKTQTCVELVFVEPEDFTLSTDEGKFTQIARNLISNALKFTEKGEVRVILEKVPDSRSAILSVVDTGIGISLEDQKKVFEEFAQVDSHLQKKVTGTGLGLPLTKKLAKLLGGEVSLESKLGQGSSFRVLLPLVYEGRSEVDYFEETRPKKSIPTPLSRKALIIDDEEPQRAATETVLKEFGFETFSASSGKIGFEQAIRLRPSLVVLDLVMPDWDGYEVLKALMSDTRTRGIPVVISTSKYLEPEELVYFRQLKIPILPKAAASKADALRNLATVWAEVSDARR